MNFKLINIIVLLLIVGSKIRTSAEPADWSKVRLYGHAFKNDDCTNDQFDFIIDNYGISTVEKRHVRDVLSNTSSSWPTWPTESTNVTLDAAVSGCQTSERARDRVFNNSGQIMLTGRILNGTATVNPSDFNKGFYLINLGEST